MRVCLDGTPLLGVRTGIGRYTEHLLAGLAALTDSEDVHPSATAFTLRGAGKLRSAVPSGVPTRSLPIPARILRAAWCRAELPPVEAIAGGTDVFHATNFVLPPLRRAAGVVTVHDLAYLHTPDAIDASSAALLDLVPRSLRRASMVLTPTEAIADDVRNAYPIPSGRVQVTPLGVDPSWFEATATTAALSRTLGIPGEYLLFVGTREPRKGLPTLLAAHAAARKADPEVPPLVLVGPSGWGPAERPGAGVLTLGYQDHDVLTRLVAGATALVMPSRYEGFGLPVLEAMAAGTPVVVSDAAALLEVAGGHAQVFPVGDHLALADVLREILDDVASREARRAHAARFTWQRCARTSILAYRAALAERSS